jgi:hypothetical protein
MKLVRLLHRIDKEKWMILLGPIIVFGTIGAISGVFALEAIYILLAVNTTLVLFIVRNQPSIPEHAQYLESEQEIIRTVKYFKEEAVETADIIWSGRYSTTNLAEYFEHERSVIMHNKALKVRRVIGTHSTGWDTKDILEHVSSSRAVASQYECRKGHLWGIDLAIFDYRYGGGKKHRAVLMYGGESSPLGLVFDSRIEGQAEVVSSLWELFDSEWRIAKNEKKMQEFVNASDSLKP